MPDGVVDEVNSGLTGVDHETVGELHRLGTGSTELARDDNLATLGTRLHNEAEDTVASAERNFNFWPNERKYLDSPADGKTTEKLVAERLALSIRRETAVLDLLSVELKGVIGELEALLDERGELADAATLLTEDLLGVGSADDDLKRKRGFIAVLAFPQGKTNLSAGVGDTDVAARVTLLGELAGEEVVQLGAEDTVSDELALLADLAGHLESGDRARETKKSVRARVSSVSRPVHPSHTTTNSCPNTFPTPSCTLSGSRGHSP